MTKQELDKLVSEFLESNEITKLPDGEAEEALKLDKRIFVSDEKLMRISADMSGAWSTYKTRKGL